MSTSANEIASAIKSAMDASGTCSFARGNTYSWINCFIDSLAIGVYQELQKLEDNQGAPAATAHS